MVMFLEPRSLFPLLTIRYELLIEFKVIFNMFLFLKCKCLYEKYKQLV